MMGAALYPKTPLLFLTRPEQSFNELGKQLISAHYAVSGTDFIGIEDFLKRVVLNGNDPQKSWREEMFEQYLNYRKITGRAAHEMVYADLVRLVEDRERF